MLSRVLRVWMDVTQEGSGMQPLALAKSRLLVECKSMAEFVKETENGSIGRSS